MANMNQTTMFDLTAPTPYDNTPLPPQALPEKGESRKPVVVGTVKGEKGRCAKNRAAILALLREQGSATNHELEEVGGNRFGARIHELRKEHDIELVYHNHETGLTMYRLKEGT
jgi:hypothetical protein